MPPIKGRMTGHVNGEGIPLETRRGINTLLQKPYKDKPKVKPSPLRNSPMAEHVGKDENLKKLRLPTKILHSLPSVKKFRDSQDFVDLTDARSDASDGESNRSDSMEDLSSCAVPRRSRCSLSKSKYMISEIAEERFCGLVWDVAISPYNRNILVACSDGLFLCHEDLSQKSKLEHVVLPGGVDFLTDGRFIALCRNTDTMYLYSDEGFVLTSFPCGKSPMTVAVREDKEILLADPSEKSVRVYSLTSGQLLWDIFWDTKGSKFQWPLYLAAFKEDNFLVADCHAQRLMEFSMSGRHVRDFRLKTSSTSEVLRPHGVCVNNNNDIFVVDTATETVEVFGPNDQFIQTIVPLEEGAILKPKCVCISRDGQYLIVGGRTGKVRLYQFWEEKSTNSRPSKAKVKAEKNEVIIKEEVKPSIVNKSPQRPVDPDEVIVLD